MFKCTYTNYTKLPSHFLCRDLLFMLILKELCLRQIKNATKRHALIQVLIYLNLSLLEFFMRDSF